MSRKHAPGRSRRQPGVTSITYWRKFATHRVIYIGLAGIIGFGIIAYFGSSPMGGSGSAREEYLADAVAVVNGEPITRRDYEKQAEMVRRRSASTPVMAAAEEGYVLSSLIDAAALRAAAKARGLAVSDADIDKAIEDVRKVQQRGQKSKLPDEDLVQLMGVASMGELRDTLRHDLLPRQLGASLSGSDRLSYEDLARSYDEIKVRHILIAVAGGPGMPGRGLPDAQAKRKAEQVAVELKGGGDFAELANKYTDDPSNQPTKWDAKARKSVASGAPKGGSLDWYKRGGGFHKDFETAAFALKQGQTSGVVNTPFGYHIIKVDETRRKLPADFEKNKTQLLEELKSRKLSEAISEFLTGERKKLKVVWKEPSLEWRYEYSKASPMGMGMQMPDRDKAETAMVKRLRAYVPKNKLDSSAALVLGQMLYRQYIMAGLPPGIAGSAPPKVDRAKLLTDVMTNYELALEHLEDQETRLTLARLYRENKQPDKALSHYRRMHKMLSWDNKPELKPTRQQVEKGLRELGDAQLADAEAKKIAEIEAKEAEQRRAELERKAKEQAQKKAGGTAPGGAGTTGSATSGTIQFPVSGADGKPAGE